MYKTDTSGESTREGFMEEVMPECERMNKEKPEEGGGRPFPSEGAEGAQVREWNAEQFGDAEM